MQYNNNYTNTKLICILAYLVYQKYKTLIRSIFFKWKLSYVCIIIIIHALIFQCMFASINSNEGFHTCPISYKKAWKQAASSNLFWTIPFVVCFNSFWPHTTSIKYPCYTCNQPWDDHLWHVVWIQPFWSALTNYITLSLQLINRNRQVSDRIKFLSMSCRCGQHSERKTNVQVYR